MLNKFGIPLTYQLDGEKITNKPLYGNCLSLVPQVKRYFYAIKVQKRLTDSQINTLLEDFNACKAEKSKKAVIDARGILEQLKAHHSKILAEGMKPRDTWKYNLKKSQFTLAKYIIDNIEEYPKVKEYLTTDAYSSTNSTFMQELRKHPLIQQFGEAVLRLWVLGTPGVLGSEYGINQNVHKGVWRFLHRQESTKTLPVFNCKDDCTIDHQRMFYALIRSILHGQFKEEELMTAWEEDCRAEDKGPAKRRKYSEFPEENSDQLLCSTNFKPHNLRNIA